VLKKRNPFLFSEPQTEWEGRVWKEFPDFVRSSLRDSLCSFPPKMD